MPVPARAVTCRFRMGSLPPAIRRCARSADRGTPCGFPRDFHTAAWSRAAGRSGGRESGLLRPSRQKSCSGVPAMRPFRVPALCRRVRHRDLVPILRGGGRRKARSASTETPRTLYDSIALSRCPWPRCWLWPLDDCGGARHAGPDGNEVAPAAQPGAPFPLALRGGLRRRIRRNRLVDLGTGVSGDARGAEMTGRYRSLPGKFAAASSIAPAFGWAATICFSVKAVGFREEYKRFICATCRPLRWLGRSPFPHLDAVGGHRSGLAAGLWATASVLVTSRCSR